MLLILSPASPVVTLPCIVSSTTKRRTVLPGGVDALPALRPKIVVGRVCDELRGVGLCAQFPGQVAKGVGGPRVPGPRGQVRHGLSHLGEGGLLHLDAPS